MQTLKKTLGKRDGSTLVGAVAICTILAIGTAGLIGISRNTSSQEADALDDTRAFLAAEAGLLVGTNWFKNKTNLNINDNFEMTHDGIDVKVYLKQAAGAADKARLISEADFVNLGYLKQLEWTVDIKPPTTTGNSGLPGLFLQSDAHFGDKGLRSQDVFYGPVFFKEGPLTLKNPKEDFSGNSAKFYGPVKVYNVPEYKSTGIDFNIGVSNSNYAEGLKVEGGNATLAGLNGTFNCGGENCFQTTKENRSLAFTPEPAITQYINAAFSGKNPSVTFKTTFVSITANGVTEQIIDIPQNGARLIIETEFPITVKDGTMNGIVTVRNKGIGAQGNIMIDLTGGTHALVYGGMYTNNITASESGTGNNVAIKAKIEDDKATNWRINTKANGSGFVPFERDDALGFYTDNGNIIINAKMSNNKKTCAILAAQLFAIEGTLILSDNIGSLNSNNYWNEPTFLRILGSLALKQWWSKSSGGSYSIITLYDQRAAALPGIDFDSDNSITPDLAGGKLVKTRWKESNVARGSI